MRWIGILLSLALCASSVQCGGSGGGAVSSSVTVAHPSEFLVGSYELLEFSILADFQQSVTQDDYQSWSGRLRVSPLIINQSIDTDATSSSLISPYTVDYDDATHLSGTFSFIDPNLTFSSIDFHIDGNDLTIRFHGTTSNHIGYVETDHWRKVSNEP